MERVPAWQTVRSPSVPSLPACRLDHTSVTFPARRANHFWFAESCQALARKIFCFTETKIERITRFVSCPLRDVSRSSRYVGHRMRWTLRRQADFSPDENAAAYGEIVWSWRRDRGVQVGARYRADDGGNKRRSPGR